MSEGRKWPTPQTNLPKLCHIVLIHFLASLEIHLFMVTFSWPNVTFQKGPPKNTTSYVSEVALHACMIASNYSKPHML